MSEAILPARSKEQRERARQLFEGGERLTDVARELSIPENTLRCWRRRGKWARAADMILVAAEATQPTEIPETLAEKQDLYAKRMSDAAVRLAEHVATLDGQSLVKSADKLLKADQTARKALKLDKGEFNPVIQLGVLCQPLPSMVRPSKQLPDAES